MAARPVLDKKVAKLKIQIKEMSDLVNVSINQATTALINGDRTLARKVLADGDRIDDMEESITKECFHLLSTQAPIASDLRYCMAVMRMIRDLERIGDHSENLAKYTMKFESTKFVSETKELVTMSKMASKMVETATEAFIERDVALAMSVWRSDERVDDLYRDFFLKKIDESTLIATHLERIADYATNICEDIMFYMDGKLNFDLETEPETESK
ncbi:MAG: phosphate signaling complex protein PhoU [Anaerovoracaceae bacterium]